MFTGIVREIGRIVAPAAQGSGYQGENPGSDSTASDTRFRIACMRPADAIEIGASISCDGVCLTVVARGSEAEAHWFEVQASKETLSRTTLGAWRDGRPVNLEPALRVGDELGGHIVTGHVDSVAHLVSLTPEGGSLRLVFRAPRDFAPYIAEKGSVTLAGVSLTVNGVTDGPEGVDFGINLIPHTRHATTLGALEPGDPVNLEIDVLARYVARLGAVVQQG